MWIVCTCACRHHKAVRQMLFQPLKQEKARYASATEANPVRSTWRVSGKLGILQSSMICYLHDLGNVTGMHTHSSWALMCMPVTGKSIWSCQIVLYSNKILQNFLLMLVEHIWPVSEWFMQFTYCLNINSELPWKTSDEATWKLTSLKTNQTIWQQNKNTFYYYY